MDWLNDVESSIKSILTNNHLFIEKQDGQITVTGKIVTMLGAVGTAAFFSAPVTTPIIIGGFVKTNVMRCLTPEDADTTSKEKCCALALGVLLGAGIGGMLGYYTWDPISKLVYAPQNAYSAGIIGGSIAGIGVGLWGIGHCLDAKKIATKTPSELTNLV